jgi:hypothetical protein
MTKEEQEIEIEIIKQKVAAVRDKTENELKGITYLRGEYL